MLFFGLGNDKMHVTLYFVGAIEYIVNKFDKTFPHQQNSQLELLEKGTRFWDKLIYGL